MARYVFDHALLPEGWAERVGVRIEDGTITHVEAGLSDRAVERVAGIALPGMPNLHSHTFQRGLAGLAETRGAPGLGSEGDSFWTWRQVMYRFLGELGPDDVEAIAAFAMMEMLEGGFTALAEFHYLHHDPQGRPYDDPAELAVRIAAAAARTGIGLTLLPCFYAFGGVGGQPPQPGQRRFLNTVEGYLDLVERSRRAVSGLDDALVGLAPHSLRAVTPDTLRAVTAEATGPIHIHAAEQAREVEDCLAWSGRRPVEWLLDHAGLDARWCLIHATHMTAAETAALARTGAVVGLCPLTEASLGDGIINGAEYAAAGGRWGIGTDSNIEISAAAELKTLEYSQRYRLQARNVMGLEPGRSTGRRLYESALAGGAQASGRRIGAIAAGYRADIVTLRPDDPDLGARSGDHWLDATIFVTGRRVVDQVFVAGRRLVANGRHHDREAIVARYKAHAHRLAAL